MKNVAHAIELNLAEELRNPAFARKFFLAESSAEIAKQLITLRKRRGLNQKQVAEKARTKQPAISRAEQADYQNWSFSTLRAIADALNARIRVLIQPYEDVIKDYEINSASNTQWIVPIYNENSATSCSHYEFLSTNQYPRLPVTICSALNGQNLQNDQAALPSLIPSYSNR